MRISLLITALVTAAPAYAVEPAVFLASCGIADSKKALDYLTDGADIQAKDSEGLTCLHFAAEYGDPKLISTLIAMGANVKAYTENYSTPLHSAAIGGRTDNARLLLAAGAVSDALNAHKQPPRSIFASKGIALLSG